MDSILLYVCGTFILFFLINLSIRETIRFYVETMTDRKSGVPGKDYGHCSECYYRSDPIYRRFGVLYLCQNRDSSYFGEPCQTQAVGCEGHFKQKPTETPDFNWDYLPFTDDSKEKND
jgi:hypothetical protein